MCINPPVLLQAAVTNTGVINRCVDNCIKHWLSASKYKQPVLG